MSDNEENIKESKKYTIEDVLEMLGGHQYYDDNTAKFIFHKLNGNKMEADHYLNHCLEKAAKLHELEMKMKSADEIPILHELEMKMKSADEIPILKELNEK